MTLKGDMISVTNGVEFYKVAVEHFAIAPHGKRNADWIESGDPKLVRKGMSVDSNHYTLHCPNKDIYNEAY